MSGTNFNSLHSNIFSYGTVSRMAHLQSTAWMCTVHHGQPLVTHSFTHNNSMLTLIAVKGRSQVAMVGTRWFCVSTCIHTCLLLQTQLITYSQIWLAHRLHTHRLGFHKEGPRNQKWSKWRLWSDPDQGTLTLEKLECHVRALLTP